MGYTKLFEELIRSSIWGQDDKTRIVWITLLACKDRNHFVRGTEEWLASAARVTPEDCDMALKKLSNPDPKSHCQEDEGRRIKPMPGGWHIVSGEYYSRKLDYAERREYNRNKQAEYRKRHKTNSDTAKRDGARQALNDGFNSIANSDPTDLKL